MLKEEKLYICLVDQEKVYERVCMEVLELQMRKKGIQEVFV